MNKNKQSNFIIQSIQAADWFGKAKQQLITAYDERSIRYEIIGDSVNVFYEETAEINEEIFHKTIDK